MKFSSFEGQPNGAATAAHVGPIAITGTAQLLRNLITIHADTQYVMLTVETAAIRLTVDGITAPTSALGFNFGVVDTDILLSRSEAENCRLIRSTGSDGAIQASQYLR
jgi:hypothetical protein